LRCGATQAEILFGTLNNKAATLYVAGALRASRPSIDIESGWKRPKIAVHLAGSKDVVSWALTAL
jgi:hypothetical protein